MNGGLVVMCVYCKDRKTIPWAEAQALTEPPMCPKDGGVMVVDSASTHKKRGRS